MRPSTILLGTFLLWLISKGRLSNYWALATGAVSDENANGAGGDLGHASSPPAITWKDIWDSVTNLGSNGD